MLKVSIWSTMYSVNAHIFGLVNLTTMFRKKFSKLWRNKIFFAVKQGNNANNLKINFNYECRMEWQAK